MDGVLLGKSDPEWTFECVEIGEQIVDEERGAGAAQKEDGFGVFVGQRLTLCERSFRPRIFGFTDFCISLGINSDYVCGIAPTYICRSILRQ